MKKYEVTLYYRTSVRVEVEAEDEYSAIAKAYLEAGDKKYDEPLLHNLAVDDMEPDVEEADVRQVKRVPYGRKIESGDDVVVVYNDRNEVVYDGSVNRCPYRDELYTWDKCGGFYDLLDLPGYKMVCIA